MEQWQSIRHLAALGWPQRRIARELGVSRNTIAAALAAEHPPRYQRAPRPSPLAPWQALLDRGLRLGLCGSRVLDELQQAGFQGSRAAFYARWSALVADRQRPEACCRFETDPGVQAQFDWSEYLLALGGVTTKVYIYGLLLGYSRRVHWFPSLAVDHPAVFEGLEAGWRCFGGACRFLLLDNARVFLHHHRGSEVRWNAHFLQLCGHYRVQPIAGSVRHPQGKGKVENPFDHLEQRFLKGSAWRDWEHFEQELAAFEARWEQRVHGTTKVPPVERFPAEKEALLPLPATPFLDWQQTFRTASPDCLVSVDGVAYSVPWPYAHQAVLVRPSQGREVRIYSVAGELIARHPKQPSGSPAVIEPQHYAGLRRRHRAAFQGLVRDFRTRYGAHAVAETFLQRLLAQHEHHPERPLGHVLDLLGAAPDALAVTALAEAVEFQLCTPRFVEERLRRQLQQRPTGLPSAGNAPLLTQLALPELEVERPLASYAAALPPEPPPSKTFPQRPLPPPP